MSRSLPADLMFGNPFAVYKMFDASGIAVYVGRTEDLRLRFRAHERASAWVEEVKRYEIEFFGSYGEAFNAERVCILKLQLSGSRSRPVALPRRLGCLHPRCGTLPRRGC